MPEGSEAINELFKLTYRSKDDAHHVTVFARHAVTLGHLSSCGGYLGDLRQLTNAGPDPNDRRHLISESPRIELYSITENDARVLKAPQPIADRGGRQSNPSSQLTLAETRIILELSKQMSVNIVPLRSKQMAESEPYRWSYGCKCNSRS